MATKVSARKVGGEKAASTGEKRTKAAPKSGASKPAASKPRGSAIDAARLAELNAGRSEAAILAECLAVDFGVLMPSVFPELPEDIVNRMQAAKDEGILKRMGLAGQLLWQAWGAEGLARLQDHPSDTVRGWGCFLVGARDDLDVAARLALIRPLADDPHFGVREWAWMAVRPHLVAELDASIALLAGWTGDASERVRRFASEALRPRGVWAGHIAALKRQPEKGLPILEPLRADPAAYVQDSVANWLNDAAKDQPDWVREVCGRWQAERPEDGNTQRIVRRALRSLA